MTVPILTTTSELEDFCKRAAREAFVAVDTEFIRERTYRPVLCLIQLALPTTSRPDAVLVDVLAQGMRLECLFALFVNRGITKVFHAGGQDLEILWHLGNCLPVPLFDTQIAAMVCGFGYQTSYASLVEALTGQSLPKSATVTNWQQRPLTANQARYALSDVTHLRAVYTRLLAMLKTNGRRSWLDEAFAKLGDPSTYDQDPMASWQKLKTGRMKPATLAIVRELAALREREAARRDILRKHVMADHALLEIAQLRPRQIEDLQKTRFYRDRGQINRFGKAILDAVQRGRACPEEEYPSRPDRQAKPVGKAAIKMLQVLLAARAGEAGIAEQFIASTDDLSSLARGNLDSVVMQGWRHDLFGQDARNLCQGRIALVLDKGSVKIVDHEN